MTSVRRWFWEALGWSGVMVLAAALLPLLALMVLLLRSVLVPAAALLILSVAVAYCANTRFRCSAHRAVRGDEAHQHLAT